MIVQIEKMLFVTPDEGCEHCDGTGAVLTEPEVNYAEECGCITRQLDEYENAFSHYEVIDAKHPLYAALKQLKTAHDEIEQREHNRVVSFLYKTTN